MIWYEEKIGSDLEVFELTRIDNNDMVALLIKTTPIDTFWDNPTYLFKTLVPILIRWKQRCMTVADSYAIEEIKDILTEDSVDDLLEMFRKAKELNWHV